MTKSAFVYSKYHAILKESYVLRFQRFLVKSYSDIEMGHLLPVIALLWSLVANTSYGGTIEEQNPNWRFDDIAWLKSKGDHYSECAGLYRHSASWAAELGLDSAATSSTRIANGMDGVATLLLYMREMLLGNDVLSSQVYPVLVQPQARTLEVILNMLREKSTILGSSDYREYVAPLNKKCTDTESDELGAYILTELTERVARAKLETPEAPPAKEQQSVSMGTCFFVSTNGHVVTNHHVIEGSNTITISDSNGESFDAHLLRTDAANDLVILKVATSDHAYLSIAPFGSIEVGQDVFTMGFPVTGILGQEPKYTNGVVSSLTGYANAANVFQMTVPIQPGSSGGPVVNMQAEVVGIASASAAVEGFLESAGTIPQNVNWAIKSEYAALLVPDGADTGRKMNRNSSSPIAATSEALCSVIARH